MVKNGKLISAYHDETSPKRQNLVPGWICEEFYREDEFGVKKIGDNGEKILKLANGKPREIERSDNQKGINYFEKNRIEQVDLASEGALVIRNNIGHIVSD